MNKLILNAKTGLELKAGRKVLARFPAPLTAAAKAGIVAAFEGANPTEAEVQAAVDAALAKRGSVIPDGYREKYGADQSCGDGIAKALTAAVTKVVGTNQTEVDLEAARQIAADNGVDARFDVWMAKELNPGMVRMNLGNVLRGMARRGDEVRIGEALFCDYAD